MKKRGKLIATLCSLAVLGTSVYATQNTTYFSGQSTIQEANQYIDVATNKILAQDRLIKNLQNKLSQQAASVDESQNETNVSEWENKLFMQSEELKALKEQMSEAESERAKYLQEMATLTEQIGTLETEKETQAQELTSLKQQLQQMQETENNKVDTQEIQALQQKIEQLEKEKSSYTQQMTMMKQQNSQLESENAQLQRELDNLRESYTKLLNQQQTNQQPSYDSPSSSQPSTGNNNNLFYEDFNDALIDKDSNNANNNYVSSGIADESFGGFDSSLDMGYNYGSNNYGVNNYGSNNYGVNNYGSNNYGVNNYGSNNYGSNNYGSNNSSSNNSNIIYFG